jgi:hypothetical protein
MTDPRRASSDTGGGTGGVGAFSEQAIKVHNARTFATRDNSITTAHPRLIGPQRMRDGR